MGVWGRDCCRDRASGQGCIGGLSCRVQESRGRAQSRWGQASDVALRSFASCITMCVDLGCVVIHIGSALADGRSRARLAQGKGAMPVELWQSCAVFARVGAGTPGAGQPGPAGGLSGRRPMLDVRKAGFRFVPPEAWRRAIAAASVTLPAPSRCRWCLPGGAAKACEGARPDSSIAASPAAGGVPPIDGAGQRGPRGAEGARREAAEVSQRGPDGQCPQMMGAGNCPGDLVRGDRGWRAVGMPRHVCLLSWLVERSLRPRCLRIIPARTTECRA